MKKMFLCLAGFAISGFAQAASCSIDITSDDKMRFNTKEMVISKTCQNFTINLKHIGKMPKLVMGHNVVITKTADVNAVVSSSAKAGPSRDYIDSKDKKIIAHTKLIGGGESTSVTFSVDKIKNGSYTFFCSYPGHVGTMKGKIVLK